MGNVRGSLSAKPIDINSVTIDRLERIFALTSEDGGCIVHTKPHHTGYSYARVKGVRYPAHRIVKAISIGKDSPGLVVDHTCGNKACLNIRHLEVVTQSENIRRGTAWGHFRNRTQQTKCLRGHSYDYRATVNGYSSGVCLTCKRLLYRAKVASMDKDKLSKIASEAGKRSRRSADSI